MVLGSSGFALDPNYRLVCALCWCSLTECPGLLFRGDIPCYHASCRVDRKMSTTDWSSRVPVFPLGITNSSLGLPGTVDGDACGNLHRLSEPRVFDIILVSVFDYIDFEWTWGLDLNSPAS